MSDKKKSVKLVALSKLKIIQVIAPSTFTLINQLDVLDQVNSTNAYLKNKPASLKANICVAKHQTNGKGRRGNDWISPENNIALSIRWQFGVNSSLLSSLAMVTGLLCVQALKQCQILDVKIKWPNDLIAHNKKLGGILVEYFPQNESPYAIIGIGINGKMNVNNANKIDQAWVDLHQLNPTFSLNQVVGEILNCLLPVLANYQRHYQHLLKNEWPLVDWVYNQKVSLQTGQKTISGIARGIGLDGALKLDTEHGLECFHAGDVSLRK